jgi:hypothetical protein
MSDIIHIPGVMTREMIKHYEDKRVYAPAEELKAATDRVNFIPIFMERVREHGDLELPNEEILGWASLTYDNGKVKANLFFDPEKMSDDQKDMLATLEKDNLSPAFLADVIEQKGAFHGQPYDAVQRNFTWKHIAVVSKGRCSSLAGCGLYKDFFDAVGCDSEKLERCVQDVMAKGHSEESAWAICRAALKESALPASQSVPAITVADQDKNIERDDFMSDELAQLKAQIAERDAQIKAFEARELETLRKAVVEHAGIKDELIKDATKDALELLLKLPKKEAGQDTSAQTDGEEQKDEVKDAEYEPGLTITVGYDYAKGFGNKSAAIRKKVG